MSKRKKVIYWIATIWLSLGMVSTAIVQLMGGKDEKEMMAHLSYPIYFLTIIGIWKILGTITVLIPKFTLLKEWAYAGFFFAMFGAAISHIIVGDGAKDILPSVLLLVLTITSWYFRPAARRVVSVN
jgi:uncharacterized membrane protein YphA (DoxX/SURF4 family)